MNDEKNLRESQIEPVESEKYVAEEAVEGVEGQIKSATKRIAVGSWNLKAASFNTHGFPS